MRLTSTLVMAVLVAAVARAGELPDHHIDFMNDVMKNMSKCRQGDPTACLYLGHGFEWAMVSPLLNGSTRHRLRAWLYRLACDGGELRGCHQLGLLISNEKLPEPGIGGTAYHRKLNEQRRKDNLDADARAARLHTRTCEAGLAAACRSLANLKRLGYGGERDYRTADWALKKACEVDDTDESCVRLGQIAEFGIDARRLGSPTQPAEKAKYLQAACDYHYPACKWLEPGTRSQKGGTKGRGSGVQAGR